MRGATVLFLFFFVRAVHDLRSTANTFNPKTFPKHPLGSEKVRGIQTVRHGPQGASGKGGRVSHAALSKAEVGPVRTEDSPVRGKDGGEVGCSLQPEETRKVFWSHRGFQWEEMKMWGLAHPWQREKYFASGPHPSPGLKKPARPSSLYLSSLKCYH